MSYTMNDLEKAIDKAKSLATERKRNFVETVDISVGLREIDLKNPANRINIEATLPNDLGKQAKVAIIAEGDTAVQAKKLGLTVIGKSEIESYAKDKKAAKKLAKEHDFFLAEPRFMPLVGRYLGKILGPRGKMPKPLPPRVDLSKIIANYNRIVKLRLKSNPVINTKIGKVNQDTKKLAENASVVIQSIVGKLEKGSNQVKGVTIKTTMGPSVKVPKS